MTPPEARPAGGPAPAAIRIRDVGKAYKVYNKPFDFLREVLTGRSVHQEKKVLSDVTLDIGRGEVVGIIGRNGAGKSTLLKIIAGTLAPSTGSVEVDGRISAILELGTGFNPAYSGRENVILSALMRGMPEADVRRKFDSIVAFAGLEDVIDEPFQTYSSGMQARLAFAAAVAVEADVIIIDEALAAGDVRFTARSLRRIREIARSGVTALFVSHTTYQVMQLCTRAIWIDGGRVRMDGDPIEVVRAYEYEMHEAIARDQGRGGAPAGAEEAAPAQAAQMPPPAPPPAPASEAAGDEAPVSGADPDARPPAPETVEAPASAGAAEPACEAEADTARAPLPRPAAGNGDDDLSPVETRTKARHFLSGQYRILETRFIDEHGRNTLTFRFGRSLRMRVAYECLLPDLPPHSCGLAVAFNRTSDFEAVMYFNTNYPHSDEEFMRYDDAPFRRYVAKRGVIEALIDPIQLKAGEYYVSFGLLPNQPGPHEFYEYVHCHYRIGILPNGFDEPAIFYPMVQWSSGPLDDPSGMASGERPGSAARGGGAGA